MIINLQKFISEERSYWSELESVLDRLEKRPELKLSLSSLERFHYLYQRTSGDLAKIKNREITVLELAKMITKLTKSKVNSTRLLTDIFVAIVIES